MPALSLFGNRWLALKCQYQRSCIPYLVLRTPTNTCITACDDTIVEYRPVLSGLSSIFGILQPRLVVGFCSSSVRQILAPSFFLCVCSTKYTYSRDHFKSLTHYSPSRLCVSGSAARAEGMYFGVFLVKYVICRGICHSHAPCSGHTNNHSNIAVDRQT